MAGGPRRHRGFTAAVPRPPRPSALLFTTPSWGLLIAQFVMVVAFAPPLAARVAAVAGAMFLRLGAGKGDAVVHLPLVHTATSIAATFFVTAGAFAAMSA